MERYSVLIRTRRINTVKMFILTKQSTESMKALLKLPWPFSKKQNRRLWIAKEIWKRKRKLEAHTPWFQMTLQSYNKIVSHRSMEQNREPRNKPMHIYSTYLQRNQKYTMGKGQSSWGNWTATCMRMILDTRHHTKKNHKNQLRIKTGL